MTNEEYYAMLDRNHLCHRCHRKRRFKGENSVRNALKKWLPQTLSNMRG